MKKLISLFVVLGLVSTSVGQQPWIKPTPLNNFGPALTDSIFGISSTSEADPTGDTYTVAPLLQSGGIPATGAGFANDLGVVGVTFDGLAESGGVNVFGNAGDTFIVEESFTPAAGPNGLDLIQVEITSVDANGNPTPWVAAGVTGPNGPWTEWRVDVASNSAGASGGDDLIDLSPFNLEATGFSAFASDGTSYGTFTPLTVDASTAAGVQGVGVIGLNGADIAGFDLARIQLFWEVSKVPEPSTGILSMVGVLAMMMFRRRR